MFLCFHSGFVLACALLAVRWWEYLGWKVWFLLVKQVRQPGLLQGGAGPQEPGLFPEGDVGLLLLRDDKLQLHSQLPTSRPVAGCYLRL